MIFYIPTKTWSSHPNTMNTDILPQPISMDDIIQQFEYLNLKQKPKSNEQKPIRKCSLCRMEGHDIRNCKNPASLVLPNKDKSVLPDVSDKIKTKKKITCSLCKMEGHTKTSCKNKSELASDVKVLPSSIVMTLELYNETILEITRVSSLLKVTRTEMDGRIDSAMKETPFLEEMKRLLLETHPQWEVVISPPRASCDVMVNSIRINLKLTDCKSSDNSVNKPAIYYSITGDTSYPYSSTWNEFLEHLSVAKTNQRIKKVRHMPTEYHYLVKNKVTGDVLLKSIFDIHTYVSNPSNDLQINWKNEFIHMGEYTTEENYSKKVLSLLTCIQKSARDMIERTYQFANADMGNLLE